MGQKYKSYTKRRIKRNDFFIILFVIQSKTASWDSVNACVLRWEAVLIIEVSVINR